MNRITLDEEWRNGNRYILAKAEKNGKLYSCEFSAFDNDYLGAAYVSISGLLKEMNELSSKFSVICYYSRFNKFVVGKEYLCVDYKIESEDGEVYSVQKIDGFDFNLKAMRNDGKTIAELVKKL